MHDIKGGKTALCDNDTLVISDYVFEYQVKSDENSAEMARNKGNNCRINSMELTHQPAIRLSNEGGFDFIDFVTI